ncbi:sigma D regulator [Neptunicella marina]|uniref:Sigma D regulator n=1 Tax=Neptunicella marina TaxID=2125989 RepID=A0A8J6LZY0_9ALTE|nr:sigma D regulator [Neptunicella marina]MBC3766565.1 sigma D regulator [Neptunicella marina]
MLTGVEQAKQKWGGAHNAIDNWLAERQLLLVMYCELAGLPPYDKAANALPDKERISEFCGLLMDYLSAGYFEVYEKLSEGEELADQLYPQIAESTDAALSFNDKYAELDSDANAQNFDVELSNLGQLLEERFEFEDKLINNLHSEHV